MRATGPTDDIGQGSAAPDCAILHGGRLTPGVVRIGDTVRRPAGAATAFTAALLQHLERAGFSGAPRYLGLDEQGRATFSHIAGHVPAKFQYFADVQVRAAATLLRAFHDATRGSGLAGNRMVVCHHDPGPNNVVFQDGRPVALIDFDMARPGDPLEDVGYMAWTWCVSSKPARGPVARQAAQVRLLADAYGLGAAQRLQLVDAMLACQARNIAFWSQRLGASADALGTTAAQLLDRIDWSQGEMAYTALHRAAFMAALQ